MPTPNARDIEAQERQARRIERQARAAAIIKTLKEHLPTVIEDRPVMMAYVYGSLADGCPLPTSDVDIALVWAPDCALSAYERFQMELEIAIEIERVSGLREADVRTLFRSPHHPYTQGLLGSVPVLGSVQRELATIPGVVPSLVDLPPGCRFADRCTARIEAGLEKCTVEKPELVDVAAGHRVRCWLYEEGREAPAPGPDAGDPAEGPDV